MLFGKWYKLQPYVVAGYTHILIDAIIWRREHLWACVECLLLAVGHELNIGLHAASAKKYMDQFCNQQQLSLCSWLGIVNKVFASPAAGCMEGCHSRRDASQAYDWRRLWMVFC